jgi:hypothetical protein
MEVSDMNLAPAEINGTLGTLITARGRPVAALTLAVSAGQVTGIQLLANPDKLTAIMAGRTLPRC